MSRRSTSRSGKLFEVFKGGRSELLNGIARLSILYEDLRLEMDELRLLHGQVIGAGESGREYRTMYFLRRALATAVEFRGGLTTVTKTAEFKTGAAFLSDLDLKCISDADKFFNRHGEQLKAFRNTFAAHVKIEGVEFATSRFQSEIGRVTWHHGANGWSLGLECDFAGQVLSGAVGSKLPGGTTVQQELREALQVMADGFVHAQAALCALVHSFLWDRFGR